MVRYFIRKIYEARLLVVLLPVAMVLTGCPYYSDIPLKESSKNKIDSLLLGVWVDTTFHKEGLDSSEIRICAFSAYQYYVEVLEVEKMGVSIERYRATLNNIDGLPIVSIKTIDREARFNFLNYSINGDTLELKVLSDEVMKEEYGKSKNLERAILKNKNNTKLFESGIKLVRKK